MVTNNDAYCADNPGEAACACANAIADGWTAYGSKIKVTQLRNEIRAMENNNVTAEYKKKDDEHKKAVATFLNGLSGKINVTSCGVYGSAGKNCGKDNDEVSYQNAAGDTFWTAKPADEDGNSDGCGIAQTKRKCNWDVDQRNFIEAAHERSNPGPRVPTKDNGLLQSDLELPKFEPNVQCCSNLINNVINAENIKQTCDQHVSQLISDGGVSAADADAAAAAAANERGDADALLENLKKEIATVKAAGSNTTKMILYFIGFLMLVMFVIAV